jgi:hypothetical protein
MKLMINLDTSNLAEFPDKRIQYINLKVSVIIAFSLLYHVVLIAHVLDLIFFSFDIHYGYCETRKVHF